MEAGLVGIYTKDVNEVRSFEVSFCHTKVRILFLQNEHSLSCIFLILSPHKRTHSLVFYQPQGNCSQCACFKKCAPPCELQLAVFKESMLGRGFTIHCYLNEELLPRCIVNWMGNDNWLLIKGDKNWHQLNWCFSRGHLVMWCNFLNICCILMFQTSIESLSYVDYDHHPFNHEALKRHSFLPPEAPNVIKGWILHL